MGRAFPFRLPIFLVENRGQVAPEVLFHATGNDRRVSFASSGLTAALARGDVRAAVRSSGRERLRHLGQRS